MSTISKLALVSAFMAFGMTGVNAQTTPQQPVPSTADGAAKGDPKQAPKTTGAMDNATTGLATSPDDVKRQTEGKPTAADEAKGATSTAPKPDVTQHSPGTVGAAPGTTPAPEKK